MVDIKFTIIILLLYLIIILFRATLPTYQLNSPRCVNNKIYYKILLDDIINNVKTGDLILFSDNVKVPINVIVGNNKFSHSGIIVVINNIPHVYEIIDSRHGYTTHKKLKPFIKPVQLTPLHTRIKYFSGNCFISSLNQELSQNQINKLTNFINNNHYYTFINYNKWFPFIFSSFITPESRFCHEFIADILDKLQITSNLMSNSKINLSTELINICNGNIYSNPIHIIPNDLLIPKNININKLPELNYCNNLIESKQIVNDSKYNL